MDENIKEKFKKMKNTYRDLTEITTPINIDKYEHYLKMSEFPSEKTQYLIQGFKHGFDIGYRGPVYRQETAANIPLSLGTPEELWSKLMKETDLKRLAGPFDEIPYEYYIQSPIGLVPKAGGQTRMIFHLSYNFGLEDDRKSLNFHTPDDMCTVQYNNLDYAVHTCSNIGDEICNSMKERSEQLDEELMEIGREVVSSIYLSKSDLKSAFKILLISPAQRCYLIMMAKNPKTGNLSYFVEKTLLFGAGILCSRFQLFSDSLKHITGYVSARPFTVTNYLDDLFLGKSENESNSLVRKFIEICDEIGCPISHEKTEWASTMMIFLGLLINENTWTVSVPREKVWKALDLLETAISRKKVTIKFIQRLTGTLNFLNHAVVPGRIFTRKMYDKLKLTGKNGQPLRSYHHVQLGAEVLRDCDIWKTFLQNADSEQLCRPFIDIHKTKFSSELNFYTDSSLKRRFGFGGIFNNRWIIGRWGQDFIVEEQPSIEFLELYALVIAMLTWGDMLKNLRICIFCDNQAMMHMVNNFMTKCSQCMKLLRILTIENMRCNRRVFVRFVKTKENVLADALSRMDLKRFWKNAPKSMNPQSDTLPSSIWPVQKVWRSSTNMMLNEVAKIRHIL